MSDASKLQAILESEHEVGEGVSDLEIAGAEAALGVVIAGGYRWFLSRFGWARVGHAEFLGLESGPRVEVHLDVVRTAVAYRDARLARLLPSFLLPVKEDGAGSLYCLDTRVTPEPPVVFWDCTRSPNGELKQEAECFVTWMLCELGELEAEPVSGSDAYAFDTVAKRLAQYIAAGEGASEEDVSTAESQLGVPIKGGYRQFLRRFGHASFLDIELYGLGETNRGLDLVAATMRARARVGCRLPERLLPILDDGDGDYICIDTATGPEPEVVEWVHDRGPDQKLEYSGESFSTWLWREMDYES